MFMAAMLLAPALAPAAEITSLKQSLALALEHNRSLAVAVSRLDKAEAEADAMTGRMLPRIDVSSGVLRTDSPLGYFGSRIQQGRITAADFNPATLNHPGYINNYQSRLGLSMPIFAGGALWAGRAKARHLADAGALDVAFRRQQLIYQTIAIYIQVLQSRARLDAGKKAVQAAEKRWGDAKSLQKRGMAINSDVMDAHVHLLRSEVALQEARSAYADSIETLRLVLGQRQSLKVSGLQEPHLNISTLDLKTLLDGAVEQRADLQAQRKELQAAEAASRESRAAYLPKVNLMAAQEWNNATFGLKNRNSTIGATVSMNLFAGGADKARVRAADAERIALELQIEDKQQQIKNEIRQAWRSLNTAEQRYHSENMALKQTSESLRIKALRHAQGLEKTSDMLDAQVGMDASRVAQIRARYDVMIARAALLLASGTLTEEVVQ